MKFALIETDLLDPRTATSGRPIAGSANIPAAELRSRIHELPPAGARLCVADAGPEAVAAIAALHALGRDAVIESEWRARDAPRRARFRLWRANPWVELQTRGLAPGRALDIGCGVGRDAVFLAARGWQVTAIDCLPDAIERGQALERNYTDNCPPIDWRVVDVADPTRLAELAASFELVLCIRAFRRERAAAIFQSACAGGRVLIETFSGDDADRRRRSPSVCADLCELGELARVSGYVVDRSVSGEERGRGLSRLAAVRCETGLKDYNPRP